MTRRTAAFAIAALTPLWLGAASAGFYKCTQPDGTVSYQELPCSGAAAGGRLEIDTTPPSGSMATGDTDYSVESQLKAMQKARAEAHKARDQAEQASDDDAKDHGDYDRARCAKHRAQVARWRDNIRDGYRNRDERDYERHMLEYHQALVDRYCGGE